MKLSEFLHRQPIPKPWTEGEKIPWNDPGFSQRMLHEHLSQAHDAASRRFTIIDQHVAWIHDRVLREAPVRILDLGCGPGLYTQRLARLGHHCVGIDFSPASIAYARQQAEAANLDCQYSQQDIRTADYGIGYDLVMSIYGEFNVFRPQEARDILAKAWHALLPGGHLLLEPHSFDKVKQVGEQPASWYSTERGLFSTAPHLVLQENFWDADARVAIERYHIVDAASAEVTSHSSSMQAYTDSQYRSLLAECGFEEIVFYPCLGGQADELPGDLIAILAHKSPSPTSP